MSEQLQAPELPGGWFFRVSEGNQYRYRVSLRKKVIGRFITSEFDYWVTDDEQEVHKLMCKLLEQLNRTIIAEFTYYGDYPPKKNVGGEG